MHVYTTWIGGVGLGGLVAVLLVMVRRYLVWYHDVKMIKVELT